MKQAPPATTILIATRNQHKVAEIRAILGKRFALLTLKDFPGAPNVVEDAPTFSGNATKKACSLARWIALKSKVRSGRPDYVLADDSGLEVDALDGAPGVLSARFAAMDSAVNGNSPDGENLAKLLRLMRGIKVAERTARFRCVIALVRSGDTHNGAKPQLFGGVCEGSITLKPRGEAGFGYDPVFKPVGHAQTFAELGEEVKNQFSHRAKAVAKMREWLVNV